MFDFLLNESVMGDYVKGLITAKKELKTMKSDDPKRNEVLGKIQMFKDKIKGEGKKKLKECCLNEQVNKYAIELANARRVLRRMGKNHPSRAAQKAKVEQLERKSWEEARKIQAKKAAEITKKKQVSGGGLKSAKAFLLKRDFSENANYMESENKMNEQILDSILFMKCLRESLCEIVEDSKIENKNELTYFFNNEASDYQVISAMVLNKIPEEKYNNLKESILLEVAKCLILEIENIKDFDEENVKTISENIVSPSTLGLSSNKNVLEFLLNEKKEKTTIETNKKKGKGSVEIRSGGAGIFKGGEFRKFGYNRGDKKTRFYTLWTSSDKFLKNLRAGKLGFSVSNKVLDGVSYGLAASAVAYLAYKVYTKFISNIGRKCDGDKLCIAKIRLEGMEKQMAELKKGYNGCGKTSDYKKCKDKIGKKIDKLENKIEKKKEEIKEREQD